MSIPSSPLVFLSYRRADGQGWAGRLSETLSRAYGESAAYYDRGSNPLGENYFETIGRALEGSRIALVLIGPQWLEARDAAGRRRLDDPQDLVHVEVMLALGRGIPVVPILLGGATMPSAAALPGTISTLAQRQAHEISDTRWEYDCGRLMEEIERVTPLRRQPAAKTADATHISVGEGLVVRGKSRVGDVAGVKSDAGVVPELGDATIEVGKQARIEDDAEVGDVAAFKLGPASRP
ncbi:MAG TPA: toll/interleukin-1 receptor domain-containing protein [Vicinamibacterales bacterium]|nr:toll/interleukin-1 receptor domain-containing protein [Vicinamibacterales bacterium]